MATDPPDEAFAGYRFHRVLGRGSEAEVYEATEQEGGRTVVIETLAGKPAEDEDLREWFAWAWDAVRDLDQDGVVDVYEVGAQGGVPFAVRQFVQGDDLASGLGSDGPLTPEVADAVFHRLAATLTALHEAGVVHGSLTPASVLVSAEDEGDEPDAYLTGFGRAEGLRGDDVAALAGIHAGMLGPGEAAAAPLAEVFERAQQGRYRTAEDLAADVTRARAGDDLAGIEEEEDDLADEGSESPSRRRRWLGALATIAIAIAAFFLITSGDESEPAETASAPDVSVPAEDPPPDPDVSATGEGDPPPESEPDPLAEPIEVRGAPTGLAVRDGVVYVTTADSGKLIGFEEESGERVVGPIDLGAPAGEVTIVDGVAWVALPRSDEVARVDLSAADPAPETIAVGEGPAGLIGVEGSIYVANEGSGQLSNINAEDSSVESVPLAAQEPRGVAFGSGLLWVTDGAGSVLRVDPENTAGAEAFEVGADPRGVFVVRDYVWVANSGDGTVTRIDRRSGESETIDVGGSPLDVASAGDRVLVSNTEGYVSAIEISTNDVERIEVSEDAGAPVGLAVGEEVWVTTGEDDSLLAVDPTP